MKLTKAILYSISAFVLSLLVMSIFFGDVMLHPNEFTTESDGDGIKNHFAYNYYIKHDEGLKFTGMNYPYGEHIFFPDAQPILAAPLKWVNENIVRIEHQTIGISIAILFLSVGFCGLFMFLILRKFNLPNWYALPIAVLIACLSPQLNRIYTHQSLSYTAFIPMLWYTILSYEDAVKRKWLRLFVLSFLIFFFAGLHLYYLALGFFFIIAYIGIIFISNLKSLKTVWKNIIPLLIASLIPVLIYQIFLGITDVDIATRIKNPWGFFHYTARFESIFIPTYTPFETLVRYYFKMPEIRWEGYGAVGVIGSLVFIFTVIRTIRFAIKKRFIRFVRFTSMPRLNQFMWSSVLLLLFSMAVPFVWGMEDLLDYIPQIKQFRSVGRFNWVFYYVFTVYAASYIFLLYKRLKQKRLQSMAQFFMFSMLILWFANDYAYLKHVRQANAYVFKENFFKDGYLQTQLDALDAADFKVDDYQAMVGLPLIYKGSEKLGIFNSRVSYRESFHYAYHLGLPMMNAYSARMPIEKSMKIGQLWCDSLIQKEILAEMPSQKPFLGIVFDNEDFPLKDYEQRIVNKSKLITKVNHVHFYEVPLSAFEHQTDDVIEQFAAKDSLFAFESDGNTYYSDVPNIPYFKHQTFDDLEAEATRNGKGALQGKRMRVELYNDTLPATDTMILSYWMKNDYLYHRPNLHYILYDTEGNEIYRMSVDAAKALNYQNGWVMVEIEIKPQPIGFKHYVYVPDIKKIIVDDVVIRPKGTNIFWEKDDKHFIFNNIQIRTEE